MKIAVNILWLILPVCCFGALPTNSKSDPTIYVVEQSTPNKLTIHVNRTNQRSATQLILRGAAMGISEQVQNVVCDGRVIKKDRPGIWSIPDNCQKLHWQVPLLENGTALAGSQQSMKSGDFIILSEASSLPRLQDVPATEALKISVTGAKTIFPKPSQTGLIALPDTSAAPFFVLLNATVVDSISSGPITLTYLLDNPDSISTLPSMASHMKGLSWLNTIIPVRTKENFAIAWLGISKKRMSLAGAAGDDILLTNYPNDGELKFGKAMLLYVALHEAFHQLAMHYASQPSWVAESLASYYGARATKIALPNDPRSSALMERFQADGDHFSNGLLAINRKVEKGDRSEYGAFYTKGISFWAAVDKALQTQGDSLDHHVFEILQIKYNAQRESTDLQKILNLSPETWLSLRNRYLD